MDYRDNKKHYWRMEPELVTDIIDDSFKQFEFHKSQAMKHDELSMYYHGRAKFLEEMLKDRMHAELDKSANVQATTSTDAPREVSRTVVGVSTAEFVGE